MDKYTDILPISYFGPIEYFIKLHTAHVKIEAHENYQKRSIRNKATILGANGIQTLSVPLVKGKTQTQIQSVEISYDESWPEYHIKTLESAYGSSPYMAYYLDEIRELLFKRVKFLFDLNLSILEYFKKIELIDNYILSEEYIKHQPPSLNYRKSSFSWDTYPPSYIYNQVFEDKYGFKSGLSILDLLFNQGPASRSILLSLIHI